MIQIESLSKRYGAATVVDDVSMQIERGSITVIVGTSGSGKSTLLRMINRLVEPSAGRVLIDGRDTADEPAHLLRRRIGYAIQGHGLFPHRSVTENIATVPRLLGWDEARIQARVRELLEVFALDPAQYAHKLPHQLSGGQQQRVGVARALAAEPAVLLMDEPFGALDPIIRTKAQDDLLDIQRRFGTTILLVTHDMDEAFRLGSRVAVMSQGKLLQYETPARLLTQPRDELVARMTGLADRALRLLSLTRVGEALNGAPAEPHGISAVAAGGDTGAGDATSPAGGTMSLASGATTLVRGTAPSPDGAIPPAGTATVTVPASANLRDALSELVWRGVTYAQVTGEDGRVLGTLSLAALLAHGRGG